MVYRDRGKQRKKSCRTLTEAKHFKANAHLGNTAGATSRTTLIAYAESWLRNYSGRTANGLRDSTRESYRDAIDRVIVPYFRKEAPSLKLSQLSPTDLRAFIAYLAAEGYAPASVRRFFAPLRALVNTAFEDGLLARNPAAGLRVIVPANNGGDGSMVDGGKRKSKHGGKPKPKLTPEQTKALLAEIPSEHEDLVFLLASTGLRISEALALTWADFKIADATDLAHADGGGAVLTIRTSKTAAGLRSLALSPETARRLVKRRSMVAHNSPASPIFASANGGRIDPHNFRQRVFKPAAERAGVERATPHSLRHGLASLMAQNGLGASQIASVLGHADGGILALKTYIQTPVVEAPTFIDEAFGTASESA